MLYVPSEHIWLPDIVLFNKYVAGLIHFALLSALLMQRVLLVAYIALVLLLNLFQNCDSFSADGNYEVTLMTKATLSYTGEVIWKPPSIYKSSCEINVQYFPFDEQSCLMKFASWTYNGFQVSVIKDFGINYSPLCDL
jgi:nicotinic acetylcholine receptor